MNILVIEDEPKTAKYLQKGLMECGFTVDIANDGLEGYQLVTTHDYDLVVLDIMLPKMDGFTLQSKIKKECPLTRILILTARDSISERVRGLESGADDYLIKPFAFTELLARIKNLLRRSDNTSNGLIIEIADLKIDMEQHKVWRNNTNIQLTHKEFSLLVLLAKRPGRIFSRTEISDLVWGISFDCGTNVVDVVIRRLRKKVDDPFEANLIHTVRGVGYSIENC
jgi:two-component system copper resistance phosphate regulon response regulator CusR